MDDGSRQSLPHPLACPCSCRANALLEGSQESALRSPECKVLLLAMPCHTMLDADNVLQRVASPVSVAFLSLSIICRMFLSGGSHVSSFIATDEGLECQGASGADAEECCPQPQT